MSKRYVHQLYQIISKEHAKQEPVYLAEVLPDPSIIISQDSNGVLSTYKNNIWDLSPYSLSPNKEPVFDFERTLGIGSNYGAIENKVLEEAKHFLLTLLYVRRGGRFGRISVAAFRKYFYVVGAMGRFCIKVNSKENLHALTLRDLFSNAYYFSLYAKTNPKVYTNRVVIDTFNSFRTVSQKYLGFTVLSIDFDEKKARSHNQHPVIPGGLYLEFVNGLSSDVKLIARYSLRLTHLITEFENKSVGREYSSQKRLGVSKRDYSLTVPELVQKHHLGELLVKRYGVTSLATLITSLYKIQYVCLHIIVLYTGMRISEALNMPFNCIREEVLSPSVVDNDGSVAIQAESLNLVSYTTKHTGIKEAASWLANKDVKEAVNILQAINLGFANSEHKDFSNTLFVSPNHLKGKSRVRTVFKPKKHQPTWYSSLIIRQEDLDVLRATNPDEQLLGNSFVLGEPWPITAHQFRRSLAFYAANSGFVSLPTLTVQFKHIASSMTKYYCRNYENISSIFGYFNPKTNTFDLPRGHTVFDYKEARVAVVVESLITELIRTDDQLYGKSSNYIQRQRCDIKTEESPVDILTVRQKTKEAVSRGEVYYRETLLGGCTNVEKCDSRMLGEFTSCLACSNAVIKPKNVSKQIIELTKYIELLEPDSGEYQVVEAELRELIAFQEREHRKHK
ncbi:hypothetical protein [Pseudoalteromonas sp. T1lg75]|uniref:hypothetical protein n=1 Tax=Pseudoalteromonas sp. T1lg75 TaxID=2077102 RepID=UPI000CF5E715|nr:hypothetical protein [Pseudoalteromonas sp. T1lg75]